MAARLPFQLSLFGRRTPVELTARQAWELAETARQRWADSAFARLCLIYAGALDHSDPRIGPLSAGGASRLWHFDYYAAEAERFLRIRVLDGRLDTEETKIRAGGLGYPQMQLPFAAYGYREDPGLEAVPIPVTEPWVDSSRCMEALAEAWGTDRLDSLVRLGLLRGFFAPAASARLPEDTLGILRESTHPGDAILVTELPDAGGRLHIEHFDLRSGAIRIPPPATV